MSGKKKAKPQRTKMKTKNESLCIPAQERRVEDSWGLSHAERGVFLADPSETTHTLLNNHRGNKKQ